MIYYLNGIDVEYDFIAKNIPAVMQALYVDDILKSIEITEIRDAFRENQMQGKAWLLTQLQEINRDSKILVVGSWIGFTSYCLYKLSFKNIHETDIESKYSMVSKYLNKENASFEHFNKDINDVDLIPYNLIINTSCEHIKDDSWFNKIPSGCIVALQSTNLKWHDHVNTVKNVEEMKLKYNLNLQYSGELKFNDVYSRFMLIGTKP